MIIIQSLLLTLWIGLNVFKVVDFDPYPFIFLNLFLSFEAAYATPLILMSSNRQGDKDRTHLLHDVQLDEEGNAILKKVSEVLDQLKVDIRLDKQSLSDHLKLKNDHSELKKELEEIKELLKNIQK